MKITEVHELLVFLSSQPQLREVFARNEKGEIVELQVGLSESLQLIIGPWLGNDDKQLAGRDDSLK